MNLIVVVVRAGGRHADVGVENLLTEESLALAREARRSPAALDRGLRHGERGRHRVDPTQQLLEVHAVDFVTLRQALEPCLLARRNRLARSQALLQRDQSRAIAQDGLVRVQHQWQQRAEEKRLAIRGGLDGGQIVRHPVQKDARHVDQPFAHVLQMIVHLGIEIGQGIGAAHVVHERRAVERGAALQRAAHDTGRVRRGQENGARDENGADTGGKKGAIT